MYPLDVDPARNWDEYFARIDKKIKNKKEESKIKLSQYQILSAIEGHHFNIIKQYLSREDFDNIVKNNPKFADECLSKLVEISFELYESGTEMFRELCDPNNVSIKCIVECLEYVYMTKPTLQPYYYATIDYWFYRKMFRDIFKDRLDEIIQYCLDTDKYDLANRILVK
jgi:hypothetical protein